MDSTILGEVETFDGSELNAKALQEDSEEVGHQNDKEESEAELGTRSDLFVQKGGRYQGRFPQVSEQIKVDSY